MLIALIIMFVLLMLVAWFARKFYRIGLASDAEVEWWRYQYNQLDKGFSEVTDAYATDMAQYEETIYEREAEITLLHEAQEIMKRREEALIAESNGISKQLDIAQKIISDHDMNCLPHIVLSSMEREHPVEDPFENSWKRAADAMTKLGEALREGTE